jgi:hypothetical protein
MQNAENYNEVQKLIYSMLTENTGTHFLDSGGSNERLWQRNQIKTIDDFYNEDEERYEFDERYKDLERSVSVFHFLTNNHEIDEVCEDFNKLNTSPENWDCEDEVYGVSQKAWDYLTEFCELEILHTFNTYNYDSDLSQVLQGSHLEINGEFYTLIQVHGGADVRGGYTDAKLLKKGDYMDGCQIHEYLLDYIYDLHLELEYINEIYNPETNKLYKDDELSRIKSIILDSL